MNKLLKKADQLLLNKKSINITVILSVFIILFLLETTGAVNRYISNLFILVLIMIIMSTSLNIATGFLGQLHLGHAGFMAIGAYTAAILSMVLKNYIDSNLLLFITCTLAAMITSGLAGLLIGSPSLRLKGDYLGILTLGFGEIIRTIITNLEITNGAQSYYGYPVIMTFPIAFWTTVIVVSFIFLFMNSRHGRAILSIREDEIASESVGVNVSKYKLLAFVLASVFAGVGGSIFAFNIGIINPGDFGFLKSVEIFVVVVFGGMGSLSGAIIASVALVFLPEILRDFDQFRFLLYSTVLILIMLYRPSGLLGTKEINLYESKYKIKSFFKKIFSRNKGSDAHDNT